MIPWGPVMGIEIVATQGCLGPFQRGSSACELSSCFDGSELPSSSRAVAAKVTESELDELLLASSQLEPRRRHLDATWSELYFYERHPHYCYREACGAADDGDCEAGGAVPSCPSAAWSHSNSYSPWACTPKF